MEQSRPRSASHLNSPQGPGGVSSMSAAGQADVFDVALAGSDDHLWRLAVEPGGARRSPWLWALGGAGALFVGWVITLFFLVGPNRIATLFENGPSPSIAEPARAQTVAAVEPVPASKNEGQPVASHLPPADSLVAKDPVSSAPPKPDGLSARQNSQTLKRRQARRRARVGQTRWWERKRAAEASRAKASSLRVAAKPEAAPVPTPADLPKSVAKKAVAPATVAVKPASGNTQGFANKKVATGKPEKQAAAPEKKVESPKRAEKASASQWQDPYD